ncbi:formate dehydrogenase subunit alpha [Pontibacillus yanchengensis]|uniref:Formate dehydrogenase subunit alpha n=2 Tax=Pontibacillus yanchengensis TaxID=462910 RepID=A0ACC7VDP2_9BACI|nr:formate dehydrogenase subunit alpha [Pontibacillus yanchengensis]MYL34706.1 formate dehydrogenase subunit alpha [Pontibacillus yanchengensis]MYL52309.1 formate dehydrogenase subunit alpha [Pontibacillus yanchengensis]
MKDHTVVNVNGKEWLAEPGQPLIKLLNEANVDLPQICYHESLGPIETCDTCIVAIDGEIKRACSTKVEAGMVVSTEEEIVFKAQKEALDRIMQNHELYCTVCDYNNGSCEIHNTVAQYGVEHQGKPFESKPYEVDRSGSFYRYDPDQCILCGRCVEVCQDVQVNETLTIDWERQQPRVIWDNDVPIDESSCVNCGQCVTVCPCNALIETNMEGEAGYMTDHKPGLLRSMIELTKKAESGYGPLLAVSDTEAAMREERIDKTKTVCTYCGVGCSFDVWTKGREVLKVEPQPGSPANDISTCVKGKFGWDYVNSDERLTKPLVREGDHFKEVDWDTALDRIEQEMTKLKVEDGPDSLAFISSSKATNEESFVMQKFARQVIGTNNIDNCSRYCQTPATKGLFRTVGHGGDSGSIDDIASAELVITIGSNTAESHPVLASRIKRSQKLFGQKLFVFDIRKHEMARRADEFFSPYPGSDLVWISAVTKYIIDQGWHDESFIHEWVNGFDSYYQSLETFTLKYASGVTGFSEDMLKQIAKSISSAETVTICWAMGVTQHQQGSDTSTAISNLLLATGNYRKNGAGAYPLRGHNNVQGCSDFGSMPNFLPGYEFITDDDARGRYENLWGVELSSEVGKDNHQMIEAIHEGNVKGMFVLGEDTGVVDSNINYVTKAFEKLDFFVVQDLFLTKTAEYADVVLPACSSLEKEGTFTNTERRIQRLYRAMEPLEETKPDWEILTLLAKKFGYDWGYHHPEQIMDEAAFLTPLFAGVTYKRLEGYKSLQWPVAPDGSDTPLLFTEGFPFEDRKAKFFEISYQMDYSTNEEFDLHVNNGRLLEHFHEGNMTYKSPGITRKTPNAFVEVSPELAEERGVQEGALVRLTSHAGVATTEVHITDRVKGKELYLPLNDNGKSAVNFLTDNSVDKDTNTPAYKEIAVKMDVLKKKGKSPIPYNNHRRGTPQPQIGVYVERKWARDDYIFPGKKVSDHGKSDN